MESKRKHESQKDAGVDRDASESLVAKQDGDKKRRIALCDLGKRASWAALTPKRFQFDV